MTIKMRLDTDGLRAMIANNPELEIEIGREVMNNIKADQIENAVIAKLELALASMVTVSGGWTKTYTIKDPKFIEAVSTLVKELVKTKIDHAVESQVSTLVNAAVTKVRHELKGEIRGMITQAITPEVAREVLLAALK